MGLGNLNPGGDCCGPPCEFVCLPCIDDCAPFAFRVRIDDLHGTYGGSGDCSIFNGTFDVEHLTGFTCVYDQRPAGFFESVTVAVSANKITVTVDIAVGLFPTVHTIIVWEKDYSPGEVPCLTMIDEEIPFLSTTASGGGGTLDGACDNPPSDRIYLTSLAGP